MVFLCFYLNFFTFKQLIRIVIAVYNKLQIYVFLLKRLNKYKSYKGDKTVKRYTPTF